MQKRGKGSYVLAKKEADYPRMIGELIRRIEDENRTQIETAASTVVDAIDGGGLVYVFGSGHSSILVEEAFHRAGGLIPVYPVLHSFLTPHTSPKISGKLERLEGVASILFARAGARNGDVMIIASNSGINAAAIEMAMECRRSEVKVIAFTSLAHSRSLSSRHSTGKKLFELADVVLDNHCPQGDALVDFSGVRVGAGSTIANCFIYNWVLTCAVEKWRSSGRPLPVYRSANVPGGEEYNEKMEAPCRSRIPML